MSRSSGKFGKQLRYVVQNTDPDSGAVVASAGKSEAGDRKRKGNDEIALAIKRKRDERNEEAAKPTVPARAKDPSASESNQQAAQTVPPFVPVPIEKSNATYMGGAKARDQADNTSLIMLGGAALTAWLFVQMKWGR